ncbi:hypothetical protein NGRA_1504 [Nosema granulosis]|uniref:Fam-f protein n=1 Tax=Nosema granulosis TaxID=83296 RepID=A0A9P6GZX7_9MICR|nr:hypothetical protein NGRA_1504 [Nosema granulosis]
MKKIMNMINLALYFLHRCVFAEEYIFLNQNLTKIYQDLLCEKIKNIYEKKESFSVLKQLNNLPAIFVEFHESRSYIRGFNSEENSFFVEVKYINNEIIGEHNFKKNIEIIASKIREQVLKEFEGRIYFSFSKYLRSQFVKENIPIIQDTFKYYFKELENVFYYPDDLNSYFSEKQPLGNATKTFQKIEFKKDGAKISHIISYADFYVRYDICKRARDLIIEDKNQLIYEYPKDINEGITRKSTYFQKVFILSMFRKLQNLNLSNFKNNISSLETDLLVDMLNYLMSKPDFIPFLNEKLKITKQKTLDELLKYLNVFEMPEFYCIEQFIPSKLRNTIIKGHKNRRTSLQLMEIVRFNLNSISKGYTKRFENRTRFLIQIFIIFIEDFSIICDLIFKDIKKEKNSHTVFNTIVEYNLKYFNLVLQQYLNYIENEAGHVSNGFSMLFSSLCDQNSKIIDSKNLSSHNIMYENDLKQLEQHHKENRYHDEVD